MVVKDLAKRPALANEDGWIWRRPTRVTDNIMRRESGRAEGFLKTWGCKILGYPYVGMPGFSYFMTI